MNFRLVGVALAATVTLLASGCSGSPPPETPSAGQEPTGSPSNTSTTAAAPERTTVQLDPDDKYMAFGHFLLKPGLSQGNSFYTVGKTELYLPGHGSVTLDAESLLPGQKVLGQWYASAGTRENPRVVAVIEVSEPARDLKPPSTVVNLVDIDPKTERADNKVEVRRYDTPGTSNESGATGGLAGSSGNVVAISLHDPAAFSAPWQTVGFDLAAGNEVWSKPGRLTQAVSMGDGALISHIGSNSSDADRDSSLVCSRDLLTNIATGQEVAVAGGEYTRPGGTAVNCFDLKAMAFPASGILAVNVDGVRDGVNRSVETTAYDFRANRPAKLEPDTKQADERSNLIMVEGYAGRPIDIRDSESGQVVHTFDETTILNVDLRASRLFDKKLWVETTDEKLVLDATNGSTLERGWTSYPTYEVDDWVLYSDGRLVPQQ